MIDLLLRRRAMMASSAYYCMWNQNVNINEYGRYEPENNVNVSLNDWVLTSEVISNDAQHIYHYGIKLGNTRFHSISNHKYYIHYLGNVDYEDDFVYSGCYMRSEFISGLSDTPPTINIQKGWFEVSNIASRQTDNDQQILIYPCSTGSSQALLTHINVGDSFSLKNILFIDLTTMFGAGNEPTTTQEFEAWLEENGWSGYQPYCASELRRATRPSWLRKNQYGIYGIEHHYEQSSPELTRIGSMECHMTLPVQSRMRRCLVLDNGNVNYYLDYNDSTRKEDGTPAVLDGTDGQVMVEIPEHYRKHTTDAVNKINRTEISLFPFNGAQHIQKCYVSAYEAALDRTNLKLCSVVNNTAQFRGGNNSTAYDETDTPLLGRPATSISLTNFRTYARQGRDSRWNCNTYDIQKTLFWLYAIEYATLNSQKAYNAALDANGYHQGGLGDGVSNLNSALWSTWRAYNPFIPCGYTNSLGNKTGVIAYDFPEGYGATLTTNVPSYRGLENPFGHIWHWTDGCKCLIQSETDGGKSLFYTCYDPDKFTSSGVTGYSLRGELPRASNYVKALLIGEDGDIMPQTTGGSSTTYYCDYFYTSIPDSGVSERGVLFGGSAFHGAGAGLSCASTTYAASHASAYLGSRLCFIPS